MSIQLSNISKSYGSQQVLKNVSFRLDEGEIVGFLGPNGAGKTTTMRILTGALGYDEGSAKICGLEVEKHPMETKRHIGYLPEHNPLYTDMYVKEYLLFVAETYRLGKSKSQRVEEVIDLVGLRPEFKKRIGELSKGYRQRVGLAQALIHDPKVLILDEPTTGLDPNQLTEIRSLIREIGKNRTVLFSTHIMQEIKAICNRVLVINKGELVADYTDLAGMNVFEENSFHLEVEFLSEIDVELLSAIEGVESVNKLKANRLHVIANQDIRSAVFDLAVKNGNKILMMTPIEQTMEEVFRNLTKS